MKLRKAVVKYLLEQILWEAYYCKTGKANDNYYKIMDKTEELKKLFGIENLETAKKKKKKSRTRTGTAAQLLGIEN